MKISKNSWHYKMVTDKSYGIYSGNVSNSLCIYFWQVVSRFFIAGLVAVVCSLILWCMIVAPLLNLVLGFTTGVWWLGGTMINVFTFFGGIMWFAFLGISFTEIVWPKLKAKYFVKASERQPKPSLIGSYIKAKKDKICPVIEFEDE